MQYGVFYAGRGQWFYRRYAKDCPAKGPYKNRCDAMEALLRELGFNVPPAEPCGVCGVPI